MTDIEIQDRTDSSRRDFLKRAAVVAWSTPVVMTVAANRAWANHGCVHVGSACTSATSPQAGGCCLKNTANGNVACCTLAVGNLTANNLTCRSPIGQACGANTDCCSGRCHNGTCQACNGGPTQGCINA